MKVYVVIEHGDYDEVDIVLGVYSTAERAEKAARLRHTTVEAFDLDDVDTGDMAFPPKGHYFDRGDFGRISNEYLCRTCGDVESAHRVSTTSSNTNP